MNVANNLIGTYSNQFTEALTEKRIEKALALSKEFEAEVRKLADPTDEIAAELKIFAKHAEQKMLGWWLRAAKIHPSPKYLDTLCAILDTLCAILQQAGKKHWRSTVISIIDVLETIKDERIIPCLETALTLDIDYDVAREVSISALIALGELGTSKAIEVIKSCLKSPHKQIRRDAELVLKVMRNKDNLDVAH